MNVMQNVLAGVAASAIFWLLDKQLLALPSEYQVFRIAVVFLTTFLAATRMSKPSKGIDVASGINTSGDFNAEVSDSTFQSDDEIRVGSGNKVRGSADVSVSGVDFDNRSKK